MAELLARITFRKDVLCGKPTMRGMRISVELKAGSSSRRAVIFAYAAREPLELGNQGKARFPILHFPPFPAAPQPVLLLGH
jgi:hypothetical protein